MSVDRRALVPLFLILGLAVAGVRQSAASDLYEQWRAGARHAGPLSIDPRRADAASLRAIAAAETDSVVVPANAYAGVAFSAVDPSAAVGSVLDELGGVNKQLWRLGHFEPLSGGYWEAGSGLSTIDRGLGYWLIVKGGGTITYVGTAAPVDSFDIPLSRTSTNQPAWNQVGNPFGFRISAANLAVVKRDSVYVLQQVANPFTQTQVKVWNPTTGAYANGSTLTANTGFWTKVVDKNFADQWTLWPACPSCVNNGWKPISLASSGDTTCVLFTTGGSGVVAGLARYAPARPWSLFFLDGMNGDLEKISLRLDASRYAHVAYAGQYSWPNGAWTTNGLVYWYWDGANYQGRVVDSTYSAGAYTALRLDAGGHARIAYNGNDYSYMKYAFENGGNWTTEIVDTRWSYNLDMALDRTGTPHVTYVGTDPVNFTPVLRYGTRLSNGTWATEDVDANGAYFGSLAIAMDAADKPHICYTGTAGEVLFATRQSASNWTSEIVGSGTSGREVSLVYDSLPHIAYWSSVDHHLRHAVRSGAPPAPPWTVELVDPSVDAGSTGLSLDLDRTGHPRIGYFAGVNQDSLRVADKLPGTVRLRVPYIAIPAPAGIAGWTKPSGADWAVSVEMEQGAKASEELLVGAASLRQSDLARLRSSSAPPPPGDYLSLAMSFRDEAGASDEYVSDFEAPAREMRWEFTARGLTAPGEARLRFSTIDLPAGTRLWITDLDHGWTREVDVTRPEPIAALAGERHFALAATAPGTMPATSAGLPLGFRGAYPNPFSGPVGLRFGLAAPTRLSVEVIDITGRVVRRIEDPAALSGERVLVWDGRDQAGRPLRAGVYLARYRIGSEQGVSRLVKLQ